MNFHNGNNSKGGYETEPEPWDKTRLRVKGSELRSPPEEIFKRYSEDFGFSKDDLKEKTILDIGSGDEAKFGDYCAENKIGKAVYSIDENFFAEGLGDEYDPWNSEKAYASYRKYLKNSAGKRKFVVAEGSRALFKEESFDLILARASFATNPGQNVSRFIQTIARLLKKGGEFRAAPIFEIEDDDEMFREELERELKKLPPDEFEWRFETGRPMRDHYGTRDQLVLVRKKSD